MFSESSVNETALNAYGAIILYLKPNSIPAGPAPKILAISLEFTVTIIVFFFLALCDDSICESVRLPGCRTERLQLQIQTLNWPRAQA